MHNKLQGYQKERSQFFMLIRFKIGDPFKKKKV